MQLEIPGEPGVAASVQPVPIVPLVAVNETVPVGETGALAP